MDRIPVFAALALPFLLSGCVTANGLSGGKTLEFVQGRFITVADQRKVPKAESNALTVQMEAWSGKDKQYARSLDQRDPLPPGAEVLRGAEPLQHYAEGVLKRLLTGGPYAAQRVDVVITNDPSYTAKAIPNHTILISQGILVNCASEDEFAFILAHEVSHLLLNHIDADRHYAAERQLEDTAASLLLAASGQGKGGQIGAGGRNGILAYIAYQGMQEFLLKPSWTRQQEDEADLLGLDLLDAAKYNNSVYQIVMQRLVSDEAKQEAKAEEERKRFDRYVNDLVASGKVEEGLNAAFNKLATGPTVILKQLTKSIRADHNSPTDRSDDLDQYAMREGLSNTPPAALSVKPYQKAVLQGPGLQVLARSVLAQRAEALMEEGNLPEAEELLKAASRGGSENDPNLLLSFYKLHVKQDRPDQAIKDLELAIRSPSAPQTAFNLLIIERANAGQYAMAVATLDQMERRFGGKDYALRIELLLNAGQQRRSSRRLSAMHGTERQSRDFPLQLGLGKGNGGQSRRARRVVGLVTPGSESSDFWPWPSTATAPRGPCPRSQGLRPRLECRWGRPASEGTENADHRSVLSDTGRTTDRVPAIQRRSGRKAVCSDLHGQGRFRKVGPLRNRPYAVRLSRAASKSSAASAGTGRPVSQPWTIMQL